MKTWRTIKLFLNTVKYGHPLTARTQIETENFKITQVNRSCTYQLLLIVSIVLLCILSLLSIHKAVYTEYAIIRLMSLLVKALVVFDLDTLLKYARTSSTWNSLHQHKQQISTRELSLSPKT